MDRLPFDTTEEKVFSYVVTPELAKLALQWNCSNRKISARVVNSYARDMQEGHWSKGNDCIVFGKDGELLNGQHRMTAVVQSGTPAEMWISTGGEKALMFGVDVCKRRTVADVYAMQKGTKEKIVNFWSDSTVFAALRLLAKEVDWFGVKEPTPVELVTMVELLEDECDLFTRLKDFGVNFPSGKIRQSLKQASFLAAFIIAMRSGVSEEVIESMCDITIRGYKSEENEKYYTENRLVTCAAFRSVVLGNSEKGFSRSASREMELRVENAIYNYAENKSVRVIKPAARYRERVHIDTSAPINHACPNCGTTATTMDEAISKFGLHPCGIQSWCRACRKKAYLESRTR